jgi:hypothetical protein
MTQQMAVAAHGGRAAPPNSGDGGSSTWGVLRLQEDNEKLREDVLVLLPASIVVSGGGRWRAIAVARAKAAARFGSKICTI